MAGAAALALAAATVGFAGSAIISDPNAGPPAVTSTTAAPTPAEEPSAAQDSDPPPRPELPDVSDPQVWASWAVMYLDVPEDNLFTGGEPGTSTTESMIKVGIAADFLAGLQQNNPPREPTADEADQLIRMIRDSDNDAAEQLYRRRGGDQLVQRLIVKCGLEDTRSKPGWWSETRMTAADAARLGACIARGDIVSHGWVAWILEQMRQVRGEGAFGFTETRPYDRGRRLAIKNGWTLRNDGLWHVSCLAIADWWTMAALVRYPAKRGLDYGASICADVAAALAPPDEPAATTPADAKTAQAPAYAGAWATGGGVTTQVLAPASSASACWRRSHI